MHKSTAKSLFGRAIRKYGANNFKIYVYSGIPFSLLDLLEIELIVALGCLAPKGYNLSPGGSANKGGLSEETKRKIGDAGRGRKHTAETKRKLSEKAIGRPSPMLGRHHSKETKEKIRARAIGRPSPTKGIKRPAWVVEKCAAALKGRTPTKTRAVFCIDTGEVFLMTRDATDKYGGSPSNIGSCCIGALKTSDGRRWAYMEGA